MARSSLAAWPLTWTISAGLDQGTTHFVPKDGDNSHPWRRSQRFLDNPVDFLRAPFAALEPEEQAVVLGYLCHVATDEVTARHAHVIRAQTTAIGEPLPHMDPGSGSGLGIQRQ